VAKRRPRHQALDEVAVSEVGRDSAGRGVRVREEPRILERGQLVADRRRRDLKAVPPNELGGRHGLGRRDVLADDRAEQLLCPLVELRKGGLKGFLDQLALSRRECYEPSKAAPAPSRRACSAACPEGWHVPCGWGECPIWRGASAMWSEVGAFLVKVN